MALHLTCLLGQGDGKGQSVLDILATCQYDGALSTGSHSIAANDGEGVGVLANLVLPAVPVDVTGSNQGRALILAKPLHK